MTDENKSETEAETQDIQEKYDELLEELALKDEELAKVKEDLEKQEAETQEYISLSQRLQADFENFKKITDKRNKELIKFANENVLKEFLDCYEDFGRALEIENNDDLKEGVELIYNKFKADVWYKASYIKSQLTDIFTKLNIPHPQAITSHTILEYFDAVDKRKKDARGYLLLSPKFTTK